MGTPTDMEWNGNIHRYGMEWEQPHIWNGMETDLYWVLDLQCWNEHRQYECAILLHIAVVGNKQNQGKDKRNHLVVTELFSQGWEHLLVDNTLKGKGGSVGWYLTHNNRPFTM